MPLSGKYDFRGIKTMGAKGILLALSTSPVTAPYFLWIKRLHLDEVLEIILEFVVNWAANNGLVLLNLGAIYVEGHFDQKAFDAAIEDALSEVKLGRKLSIDEVRAIDAKVIAAARRFLVWTK